MLLKCFERNKSRVSVGAEASTGDAAMRGGLERSRMGEGGGHGCSAGKAVAAGWM